MKILIAEDDPVSRRLLETHLTRWGYEVIACKNGVEAWEAFQKPGSPLLAILDWMMPHLDGLALCRKIRKLPHGQFAYLMMLTAKTEKADILAGLNAGANDYVVKPFDAEELKVRVGVGQRVIELQNRLIEAERHRVLTQAAGAAAHEINQPLTVLMGTVELLRYQLPEDSPLRESIDALYSASEKISEIVKKMGRIRQYVTKPYIDDVEIIDLDAASDHAQET